MLCFLCGKKIGVLRALFDQQYCSPEHRKESRLASANAYREEEDFEPWTVARSHKKAPPSQTHSQAGVVFAFLIVGLLLVTALLLPNPGNAPGPAHPPVSLNPTVTRGFFQRTTDGLSEWVRSASPITLHTDFSAT